MRITLISTLVTAYAHARFDGMWEQTVEDENTCEIKFEDWLGELAFSFKTEKGPTNVAEYFLFVSTKKSDQTKQYCTLGQISKKNCYNKEGNKFVHEKNPNLFATLENNGDLTWSHGYTSRIVNPCPEAGSCTGAGSWDDIDGKTLRSWDARNEQKTTLEMTKFYKKNRQWCTWGKESKKMCYWKRGDYLVNKQDPSVRAKLQPNGVVVWSEGYRSGLTDEGCGEAEKEIDYTAEDAHEPCRPLDWKDWWGSYAYSFKSGTNSNPDYAFEVNLFMQPEKFKYCSMGTKSGKNCYKKVGNTLVHPEDVKGVLQPNGDIRWSHGYTTRLWNPCEKLRKNSRHQYCKAKAKDFDGLKGKSWSSWDAEKKSVDEWESTLRRNKLCFKGSKSGRNCVNIKGNRLISTKYPWITGKIEADGELVWSHGYRSRPEESPCAWAYGCKVTADDWINQQAEVWRLSNPEKIIGSASTVKIGKLYCTIDNESKQKDCYTKKGLIFTHTSKKQWCYQLPNGDVSCTTGYGARLINDPCQGKKAWKKAYGDSQNSLEQDLEKLFGDNSYEDDDSAYANEDSYKQKTADYVNEYDESDDDEDDDEDDDSFEDDYEDDEDEDEFF